MASDEQAGPLRIHATERQDARRALELVYRRLGDEERRRRVEELLAEPSGGVEGLWAAYRGQSLVAALRASVMPGRAALLTPPRTIDGESASTAAWLLSEVLDRVSAADVRLLQALTATHEHDDAKLLAAAGFRQVTNLLFLVWMRGPQSPPRPTTELEFVPCTASLRARLSAVVERTYVGSLDCPEVDGLRPIDDVLAGYAASGASPERWLLARHDGRDVGCLLLADHAASHQWELIYMGLAPEARGRGWGTSIVRHAQWLAGQAERERIVLAVDRRNGPALDVYAAANFVIWDERAMFLRTIPDAPR